MDKTVKIWKGRTDGEEVYRVQCCGHYAEFPTQTEAAEFAEKCLSESRDAEK